MAKGEAMGDPAGCVVRFQDDEFTGAGRDVVYYVRALQEPTPAINGAPMSTEFDGQGRATARGNIAGSTVAGASVLPLAFRWATGTARRRTTRA